MSDDLRNPYRPGAGQPPPFLAGREAPVEEFRTALKQERILENVILTGLRGVGKTVLLEALRPLAVIEGWYWVGTDLSEAASISEEAIVTRLLADLAVVSTRFEDAFPEEADRAGFGVQPAEQRQPLDYEYLCALFNATPGLNSDKLKAVLERVAQHIEKSGARGIVFAYDEAQKLEDHADKETFPLSLLLDVFQSLQRKGIPFLLVLTGLPTLFPRLVESRTYTERMFHTITLDHLHDADARQAILVPIKGHPLRPTDESIDLIVRESGGYPYFIQFICREVYEVWIRDGASAKVHIRSIIRKLDNDFFRGRWDVISERSRDFLAAVAQLPTAHEEFTLQEAVDASKQYLEKPFSPSNAGQVIAKLCRSGLVYKRRHGRYKFAVPLLGRFIRRQGVLRPREAEKMPPAPQSGEQAYD